MENQEQAMLQQIAKARKIANTALADDNCDNLLLTNISVKIKNLQAAFNAYITIEGMILEFLKNYKKKVAL